MMNDGYQDIKRVMAEASISFEDADKAMPEKESPLMKNHRTCGGSSLMAT